MKRLIVFGIISLGACAIVDNADDRREPEVAAVTETAQEINSCDGSPGQWPGCRGNGCAVCAELVGNAPCYFLNHPACARNTTCAGQYFTCNDACPPPTSADYNCTQPPPTGPFCGDLVCNNGESCANCPGDCQPCNCGTCADGSSCCGGCHDGSFCM